MAWKFNPFTGKLDFYESVTGYVPYTGATGNVDLGANSLTATTIVGGTTTTADLSLKTTSGIGATGADMHFLVGNNGATEAMTILNSGNVGIGTSTPTYKLEVVNSASRIANIRSTTTHGTLEIDAPTNFNSNVVFRENATDKFLFGYNANQSASGRVPDTFELYSLVSAAPVMALHQSAPANSLFIDSTGRVGIGTATPSAKLHTLSTTEQLRLGYNASNYFSTTVDFRGAVTFNAVGSGPKFIFSDNIESASFVDTVSNYGITVVSSGSGGILATDPVNTVQIANGVGVSVHNSSDGTDAILCDYGYAGSFFSSATSVYIGSATEALYISGAISVYDIPSGTFGTGYTGDLNDSTFTKIAEVISGVIVNVYF